MSKLGKVILPAVLVALMVLASSSSVFAATELAYDDGVRDNQDANNAGGYLAVRFSLPSGWSAARLLTARFYKYVFIPPFPGPGTDVIVHILGSDGQSPLIAAFTFDIAVDNAWNDADLTGKSLVVTGDFYIAVEYLFNGDPLIGLDQTSPIDGRSYRGSPGSWASEPGDLMIRAVVGPVSPVGGMLVGVNKLDLLAPYLALVGLVGAVTVAVAVTRRRKP